MHIYICITDAMWGFVWVGPTLNPKPYWLQKSVAAGNGLWLPDLRLFRF